jgi:hypothetical protein
MPLGARWPVLFSHAVDPEATVATVLGRGVRRSLKPRLTSEGARQLPALLDTLSEVRLSSAPDARVLSRCRTKDGALDASAFYKLRTWGGVDVPSFNFVWENHAPPRVQFFAWVLSKARTPSRASLLRKNILTAAEAGCLMCSAPLETVNHIFLECVLARCFWAVVEFHVPDGADVRQLHAYDAPSGVPAATTPTFLLLCLWNLWKHRNAAAFREQRPCLSLLLIACREDARMWRVRLPGDQDLAMEAWLRCLTL